MKRTGSAEWVGNLKNGNGTVSTASGTLNKIPYSFHTRFEEGQGTNPEELIAAAHAGCFSMALSAQFTKDGLETQNIQTKATVELAKTEDGFMIPAVHLDVTVQAPHISRELFDKATKEAKDNCPVSKLMNAKITMTAVLK